MPQRPCLEPGCLEMAVPGGPRCWAHGRQRDRKRTALRRHVTSAAAGGGAARRLRRQILRAGGAVCHGCGLAFGAPRIEVDHTVPISEGGADVDGNVRPLCVDCHAARRRGGRTEIEGAPYRGREV